MPVSLYLEVEFHRLAQRVVQAIVEVWLDETCSFQHLPDQGAFEGLDGVFEDVSGYVDEDAAAWRCGGEGVGNGHL